MSKFRIYRRGDGVFIVRRKFLCLWLLWRGPRWEAYTFETLEQAETWIYSCMAIRRKLKSLRGDEARRLRELDSVTLVKEID